MSCGALAKYIHLLGRVEIQSRKILLGVYVAGIYYQLIGHGIVQLRKQHLLEMSGDYDLLDFVRTDESLSTFASRSSDYYVHLVIVGG